MPELVLNEDGSAKVVDGKVVMKGDDGQEFNYDVVGGYDELKATRSEAGGYRKKLRDAEKKLESFGDLDPDEARTAIGTVADLTGKHKDELETLKTQMETGYKGQLDTKDQEIAGLKSQIFKHKVTDNFHTSEVAKTLIYSPTDASIIFGNNFEVNEDGILVGKLNGQMIHSKEKPGNPAGFDEALQAMIDARPDKDAILKPTGARGGGSPPGGPGPGPGGPTFTEQPTGPSLIKKGLAEKGLT